MIVSAKKASRSRAEATKRLIVLAILIAALVAALGTGTALTKSNKFTPDLALDLEGGTQLILTPIATDGSQITDSDVAQAIEIIRQRVDASGVAEAEITSQGGSNIVVSLPGKPSQETLDLVRTSAVLRLRPVLARMAPNALSPADVAAAEAKSKEGDASSKDSAEGSEKDKESGTDDADKADKPSTTPYEGEELIAQATKLADSNGNGTIDSEPAKEPENSSDLSWITEKELFDAYQLQCGTDAARIAATSDDPKKPFVACDSSNSVKYILGPAEIEGTDLTKATSSLAVNSQGTPTGGWAVNMEFNSKGAEAFHTVTERIHKLQSPRNQFAIVLDGQVLSAPVPSGAIAGGRAEITSHFTSEEAAALANQLSFGSLPLNFTVQSEEQISATLGTEQLSAGLIAGLIGLAMIIVYLLWQYHALGLISAGSIALSTGLSFFVICLLSWLMGYRLSMAGVLGMIVSVGITADSFIVYFERIRDEIRDGRTISGAVHHGWDRAKRTIIISDAVNLLASIVLYVLTVGSVRGFAFTLGITTVLDLIVVMMFTHPLMVLLMKTKYFGEGKLFSGLEERQLQRTPLYRGRGYGLGDRSTEHSIDTSDDTDTENADIPPSSVITESRSETLAQQRARERREAKEALKDTETDDDAASEGSDA